MEQISRFLPEMKIGILCFIGSFAAAWFFLSWVLHPDWIIKSKKPECKLYQWTIMLICLHMIVGIGLAVYQSIYWYQNRLPMDTLYTSWPLSLFYLIWFVFDLYLIVQFFLPTYRKYKES